MEEVPRGVCKHGGNACWTGKAGGGLCGVPGVGHVSGALWASWHPCGPKLFFGSNHKRRILAPNQGIIKTTKRTLLIASFPFFLVMRTEFCWTEEQRARPRE